MPTLERTLAIIKPDAVYNLQTGAVINLIEHEGFQIVDMQMIHLTIDQARDFYRVHEGKHFFEKNAEFMSSGPCVFVVLEGEDVIKKYRQLMGPTDRTKAHMGTLRYRFGTDITRNAVHGSDSPESAKIEIEYFDNIRKGKPVNMGEGVFCVFCGNPMSMGHKPMCVRAMFND